MQRGLTRHHQLSDEGPDALIPQHFTVSVLMVDLGNAGLGWAKIQIQHNLYLYVPMWPHGKITRAVSGLTPAGGVPQGSASALSVVTVVDGCTDCLPPAVFKSNLTLSVTM